jgi:hypothetical protein
MTASIGHLTATTFRRMWWRAEVLGSDVDLTRLGEDELVNIMERPTLFSDRRLARHIALSSSDASSKALSMNRMKLMREATKRLLRLTPFVAFPSLDDEGLRAVVSDAFDAGAAGIAGDPVRMPTRMRSAPPDASTEVTSLESMRCTHAPRVDVTASRSTVQRSRLRGGRPGCAGHRSPDWSRGQHGLAGCRTYHVGGGREVFEC